MESHSATRFEYSSGLGSPDSLTVDYVPTDHASASGHAVSKPPDYVSNARRMLAARRDIAKILPKNLFRDSAWDVLLELYIGTVENTDVYVKQAIIASGECPATAMRIISRLDSSGFLRRKGDESDQRRVVVSLTPAGIEAMEMMLQHMGGDPDTRSLPRELVLAR